MLFTERQGSRKLKALTHKNTHTALAAYNNGVVAPLPLLTNDSVQLGVQSLRRISDLGWGGAVE